MKNLSLIILVFSLFLTQAVLAENDGKGGQPGVFRDLNLGGRPAAMGGAFTAIAEGGSGHLYNPAGPAQSRNTDITFAYRAMRLDRRLGYVSVSVPARENATLSFNWIYAGTADLPARDDQGFVLDNSISYNENLLGITFSKQFIPELLFGGRVFYVQNNIANISAYTVGIDLGVLTKIDLRETPLESIFPTFQAGMAIENMGANYQWTTTDYWNTRGRDGITIKEEFPVNFRVGTALLSPNAYVVAIDLEFNSKSVMKTHFGGEYTLRETLSLRAGLDDLHPCFGVGFIQPFKKFSGRIDIAYLMDKVNEGDDVLISFDIFF